MLIIVEAILARVLQLLSIVGFIQSQVKTSAQESHALEIQTAVLATGQYVADNTVGIPKVLSNQAALLAAIGIAQTDILAAIANLTNGTTPVVPITPPPTGYGPPSSSDLVNAIWHYTPPGLGNDTLSFLEAAGAMAFSLGQYAVIPIRDEPGLGLAWELGNAFNLATGLTFPDFDVTAILPTDSIGTWLNRIDTQGNVWTQTSQGAWVSGNLLPGFSQWVCMLSDADFAELKALANGLAPGLTPPVWPGLSAVTLGTPVAISGSFTVTGPMDGILVNITSVPSRLPNVPYDTQQAWRHLGALTFTDDNGESEAFQPWQFQDMVFCPKTMAHAASCSFRVDPSITGTVTPWVVT